MIAAFLLLSFASVNATSAANVYNISATSYGNYFNESGHIKNANIKAGDVLDLHGTIRDKNMLIDRPLNITSKSKTGKIINGTITILSGGSGSNVTGLKINNSRDEVMGIILLGSDHNTLKGNTIQSDAPGGHGIALAGSDYNNIVGNNMSSFGAEYDMINFPDVTLKPGWRHSPILLQNSNHTNIINNYVLSSVSNCIYLSGYGANSYTSGLNYYNNIINNTCIGVDTSWCYAIQMMGSHNTAENNTITVSDQGAGVYAKGAYRGISSESGGNIIIGNTITATFCGIFASSDSIISRNTIFGYKDDRTADYTKQSNSGIDVGSNCTVSDNVINLPYGGYGIYITGGNCDITGNNITTTDANKETIYLYGQINNINIEDNTINSKSTGILLKKMSTTKYPTRITMNNNNITTSSTYAINTNEGANNTITQNYLVSNNGNKVGNNAVNSGSGDTVKDNTPASVTLSPSPGYYKNSVQVTLKMNETGNIYYTTNGTTPTTKNKKYTAPINITKTTILKFITTDNEGKTSLVQTKTYTIDKVKPVITKIDPSNNAVKVSTSRNIKVTFNENIKEGNNWIELKNSNKKAITFTTSTSGKVLTIKPKSKLAESKYTLTIHSGAVTDLAGNPVALKSSKFSVGTAPKITKVDPQNNAVKVSTSKTIKVTFNENIKKGSKYWIELKNSNKKAISFTTTIKGKVLTIKPKSKLAESKYTLTIHSGAVTDLAGNPVALKTSKFSVGTPPKVTKTDPKNNAVKVSTSKTIKVTFNENIKKGSNYWIELVANNGSKIAIKKSIKNKTLTITHTAKLKANTKYKLVLHTGSVTDKAGNPIALKTITFTTGKT